jgi:6-pyruvoyltetrahydropterin/6-carboxytetrahydropterin synthase
MIYITRKVHFNAAHKLFKPEWSDAENAKVFGKCSNPNWHGHNFELFVTVKGTPNPETGFVIDLKVLKDIIEIHAVDQLDHKNLNLDVPFMHGIMASTENLAMAIWRQLVPHIQAPNYHLHSVKLYETERNFVEYFGE